MQAEKMGGCHRRSPVLGISLPNLWLHNGISRALAVKESIARAPVRRDPANERIATRP
ncbi:hypothetical protein GCM10023322_47210 [Rugosimonospora acidiphila]|uniref:Uncharacterized protein n=1 Tax=Rugosimonospora acidiphila TaxID=556531 RepID=A0ABP9S4E0_9ACTN